MALKLEKTYSSFSAVVAAPELVEKASRYDVVVASRTKLPRISEKIASKSIGRFMGVTDVFSNFRAYKKETVPFFNLRAGETFGAEPLVIAKKRGLKIGETTIMPPPRRSKPRIGGNIKASLRILWALLKVWAIYLGF